jgi:hypothetical protein
MTAPTPRSCGQILKLAHSEHPTILFITTLQIFYGLDMVETFAAILNIRARWKHDWLHVPATAEKAERWIRHRPAAVSWIRNSPLFVVLKDVPVVNETVLKAHYFGYLDQIKLPHDSGNVGRDVFLTACRAKRIPNKYIQQETGLGLSEIIERDWGWSRHQGSDFFRLFAPHAPRIPRGHMHLAYAQKPLGRFY